MRTESTHRRGWLRLPVLLAALALLAAACGNDDVADPGAPPDDAVLDVPEVGGSVEIGWIPWDEAIAVTHLWAYVFEEAGVDVDLTQLEVGALYAGLAGGDLDLFLDSWLPLTHEDYWEQFGDDIEDLGVWYDAATLEIAVPDYVDIDSLTELDQIADQVDRQIVGIEPGAGLTRLTLDEVIPTYASDWELLESSTPAMLAELRSATGAGDPVVVTLWTPHWAYGAFPIKNLEDPEGSLGEAEQIHALARAGFAGDHPEIAEWMDNWSMPDEALASLAFLVIEEYGDGNERDAVLEWLSDPDNAALVQSWIS